MLHFFYLDFRHDGPFDFRNERLFYFWPFNFNGWYNRCFNLRINDLLKTRASIIFKFCIDALPCAFQILIHATELRARLEKLLILLLYTVAFDDMIFAVDAPPRALIIFVYSASSNTSNLSLILLFAITLLNKVIIPLSTLLQTPRRLIHPPALQTAPPHPISSRRVYNAFLTRA